MTTVALFDDGGTKKVVMEYTGGSNKVLTFDTECWELWKSCDDDSVFGAFEITGTAGEDYPDDDYAWIDTGSKYEKGYKDGLGCGCGTTLSCFIQDSKASCAALNFSDFDDSWDEAGGSPLINCYMKADLSNGTWTGTALSIPPANFENLVDHKQEINNAIGSSDFRCEIDIINVNSTTDPSGENAQLRSEWKIGSDTYVITWDGSFGNKWRGGIVDPGPPIFYVKESGLSNIPSPFTFYVDRSGTSFELGVVGRWSQTFTVSGALQSPVNRFIQNSRNPNSSNNCDFDISETRWTP